MVKLRRSMKLILAGTVISFTGAVLIGPNLAQASPPPPQPPPSCGNSVQLQPISYAGNIFKFRVVGVDLYQWLGSGYGALAVQAGVLFGGVQLSIAVNASGYGGANTGTRQISIASNQDYDIDAEIRTSANGQDLCFNEFIGSP